VAVIAKAAFEAATGNVALSFLHFGLMGIPVAACHAGGVIGGLVLSLLLCVHPSSGTPFKLN
jgi:hypothetical protein